MSASAHLSEINGWEASYSSESGDARPSPKSTARSRPAHTPQARASHTNTPRLADNALPSTHAHHMHSVPYSLHAVVNELMMATLRAVADSIACMEHLSPTPVHSRVL